MKLKIILGVMLNEVRLSKKEAMAELGLSVGFSDSELKSVYRKLIAANHPDRGGNNLKADRIISAYKCLSGDTGYQELVPGMRSTRPPKKNSFHSTKDGYEWLRRRQYL